MKNKASLLLSMAVALTAAVAMTACGSSGGGGSSSNNGTVGINGIGGSCLSGTAQPYGTGWNTYQNLGIYSNPYTSGNVTQCAIGTVPACDGAYGMICVPTALIGGYQVATYSYGYNGGYATYPSYGYNTYGYSSGYSAGIFAYVGYNSVRGLRMAHEQAVSNPGTVAQTCTVGYSSCNIGTCRPLGTSSVGICAQ